MTSFSCSGHIFLSNHVIFAPDADFLTFCSPRTRVITLLTYLRYLLLPLLKLKMPQAKVFRAQEKQLGFVAIRFYPLQPAFRNGLDKKCNKSFIPWLSSLSLQCGFFYQTNVRTSWMKEITTYKAGAWWVKNDVFLIFFTKLGMVLN